MLMKLSRRSQNLISKFDEIIKKSIIEFCKYYLDIIDYVWYVYTYESHFYTKNLENERWILPCEEFHKEQIKSRNKIICYKVQFHLKQYSDQFSSQATKT